jgi:excisionase family DNA binding protein
MQVDNETVTRAAFSIGESARKLGVGKSSVWALIAKGSIRRVKLGGRTVIPASEIERILAGAD